MWSDFPFLLFSSLCVGKCMESCTSTMSRKSSLTPAFPRARLWTAPRALHLPLPLQRGLFQTSQVEADGAALSLAPSMEHDA